MNWKNGIQYLWNAILSGCTIDNSTIGGTTQGLVYGTNVGVTQGMLTDPTITDSATVGAYISITAADVIINSDALWGAADNKMYRFTVAANLALLVTDNAVNYIYVDYSAGTPVYKATTDRTIINNSNYIPVARLYIVSENIATQILYGANARGNPVRNFDRVMRLRGSGGLERESGLAITETATRVVNVAAGVAWFGFNRISLDACAQGDGSTTSKLWYHSSGNWTSADATAYDNTQYDNGTNLATLTNTTRYAVNWIYRCTTSKCIAIVLGNGDYTLAQAEASMVPPIPDLLQNFYVLVGRVIVQKSAGTAYAIENVSNSAFTQAAVTTHNDLGGLQGGDALNSQFYHATSAEYTGTGTGNFVRETSPTLVTPLLGTPTSGNLANCTAATTDAKGVSELATDVEALTGESTSLIITSANLRYVLDRYQPRKNLIGIAGQMGFGVGICPVDDLPTNMTPMAGHDVLGNDNYGNYQFTDGSVMVWVPKFYYKITTLAIDIKGVDTYATTALANAAGYALHRAFIDGGAEKSGFFVDKYMCSKVANGAGYTAASIKNGLPLSSVAAHNPFSGLTGGADYYYSAIDLAHRRDGVNGAVNASSIFFCTSKFIYGALAMLSMAHGQAATSTTNCAWYLTDKNYPKGCNNNALKDTDDTTVIWETDGYSNCGKTGSAGYGGGAGNVFAKSTHNGQNCGIADLNGLMYEIAIGATCIATTKAIEAISQANPCQITITGHGLVDGDAMRIGTAITQADWSGLNDKAWIVTKINDDNFTVAFNSSAFGTAYDAGTDPGTCVLGTFYAAKEAAAMKTITHGNSGATDHWGATGVAALMDRFAPPFKAAGAYGQRFGSGANQVLSEVLSGAGYVLTGLGFPKDGDGVDTTGTNLFGKDYFYQYVVNEMCLLACAYWSYTTTAGVWLVHWDSTRTYSSYTVGFRTAAYPA